MIRIMIIDVTEKLPLIERWSNDLYHHLHFHHHHHPQATGHIIVTTIKISIMIIEIIIMIIKFITMTIKFIIVIIKIIIMTINIIKITMIIKLMIFRVGCGACTAIMIIKITI